MTKKKSIIKWTLRIVAVLILINLISFYFVNKELEKTYGAFVEKVDTSEFNQEVEKSIVIKNANVLSENADSMLRNKTVLIKEGIITKIADSLVIPNNSKIIDGTGKYLIPGLIDAHIHLWHSPNDFLLYIANGVTTIRELKGSDYHLEWRDEIKAGKRSGPNLLVSSTKLQSKGFFEGIFMHWSQGDIIMNNAKEAKKTIRELKSKGYDAIKVGGFLNKESYIAVNEIAKKLNIPVVGHIPYKAGLDEFWKQNQKEVVHIEEFVKHLNYYEFGYVKKDNVEEFLSLVRKRGKEIAKKLAEKKIAVNTTLWLMESFSKQRTQITQILKEVEIEYVNPGLFESSSMAKGGLGWLPDVNRYMLSADATEEEKINDKVYWDTYIKANQLLLKIFIENGVKVLTGTDANVPVAVPGFSIYDEMQSMYNAGMTTNQIIRSTTSIPAEIMKLNTGKIKSGYKADVVLLNKNPLANIENTKSIEIVIVGGRVFNRNQLNQMLEAVKAVNNASREKDISSYLK